MSEQVGRLEVSRDSELLELVKIVKGSNFTFDPESHTYRLAGVELPSVSRVMESAGLVDTKFFTEASRFRGAAAHAACQLSDEGDLDETSLDETTAGFLGAYRKFQSETGFVPLMIEERLFHPTHRYAGTIDRVGMLHGNDCKRERLAVIDLKSGQPLPNHCIQLAAYANLLPEPASHARLSVYLREDGSYRLVEHPLKTYWADLGIFLAALSLLNWRQAHGVRT